MSAIYGFIGEGDLSLLRAMGESLKHRGDHCLEWSPEDRVFLGQRGLKEGLGRSELGGLRTVLNGILYNRDEILSRLKQRREEGQPTDADLIQAAYTTWGTNCFQFLNGDFVIAIWDEHAKHLTLARDPLGVRAVYYFACPGFVAFASEYKAFLALNQFASVPDLDTIQYFHASKYLPVGKTLLKDVCSVPAGNWIQISSQHTLQQQYWDIRVSPRKIPVRVAEESIRKLFLNSLEKRIVSLEQLGVALSGGIDSSAIVGALRALRPNDKISTFTIGSGHEDPEVLMARITSSHFGTDHHEIIVNPNELEEDLPGMVWHLEDPVGRTESYLYYRLMRNASLHVNIIFGGNASDGLFAGMPRHKVIRLMQYIPVLKGPLEEFYHYSQASHTPRSALGKAITQGYHRIGEVPAPRIIGAGPISSPKPLPQRREGLLNHTLRQGVLYGGPNSLTKAEKTHMAYGVEFRSPFTDIDLVNYAFQLPEQYKLHFFKEKYILRRALSPFVPAEILNRPKFPQRMEYDSELSRVLELLADRYLNPQRIQARKFYNPAEIERIRRRPAGRAYGSTQAMRLWTAILTEIWAECFLDRRDLLRAN